MSLAFNLKKISAEFLAVRRVHKAAALTYLLEKTKPRLTQHPKKS